MPLSAADMKGILLLNGTPYEGKIDCSDSVVYCCDGAYEWAKDKVRIDKNIGDFDSLGYIPVPAPEKIYPSEKDFTDGEIALYKMIADGIDQITVYGGGGGREDHFLGNLNLLYAAHARGVSAKMITENSVIFASSGRIPLGDFCGCTFSLLPFGNFVRIMESEGCKYAYPQRISAGECRGISNIVISRSAFVRTNRRDVALIIINRGKV